MEEWIGSNTLREPQYFKPGTSDSERIFHSVRDRVERLVENSERSENIQMNGVPDSWTERIFPAPEKVQKPNEREEFPNAENRRSSLDVLAQTPIRRLWFIIANASVTRKLSENTLDRAGITGIFATLASWPLLNLGSNIWLYHSIAKPLSGIDFLSFSSLSGSIGWAMFVGWAAITWVNFLISRGRLFDVWKFCKLNISNDPKVAHLHLQRNLRNMDFTDLRTKLDFFSDDVLRSLSEIAETEHEAFRGIREIRMSSWMLAKPRIRREMVGRIRSEGFDCEEIPGEDERIGIWKKLGLCSLTIGKKGFFRFMKGMFAKKLTEGGVRVWMERSDTNGTERQKRQEENYGGSLT